MNDYPESTFACYGHTWGVAGDAVHRCRLWLLVGDAFTPITDEFKGILIEGDTFLDDLRAAIGEWEEE